MITKIYKAETLSEAIDTIKKEMGSKAIIVSTKKIAPKRGLLRKTAGGVEVTASVEERLLTQEQIDGINRQEGRQAVPSGTRSGLKGKIQDFTISISQRAQARSTESKIESLEKENAALKDKLKNADNQKDSPAKSPVSGMLEEQGFAPELIREWDTHAESLPQNVVGEEVIDACADFLLDKFNSGAKELPKMFALVGPSASGKSLTSVKLALKLAKEKKKAVILSADDDVPSFEHFKKVCDRNNIECVHLDNTKSFDSVVKEYAGYDHVLIDTKSLSPRRHDDLLQLKRRLGGMNFPVYVVLSARDDDAMWVIRSYTGLMMRGLIFTHLDEIRRVGVMFNVMNSTLVPVAYFGIGRDEKEDIEAALGERLVSLLIGMQLETVNATELKVALS